MSLVACSGPIAHFLFFERTTDAPPVATEVLSVEGANFNGRENIINQIMDCKRKKNVLWRFSTRPTSLHQGRELQTSKYNRCFFFNHKFNGKHPHEH